MKLACQALTYKEEGHQPHPTILKLGLTASHHSLCSEEQLG
jgi:hypothetical protein